MRRCSGQATAVLRHEFDTRHGHLLRDIIRVSKIKNEFMQYAEWLVGG